MSDTKQVTQMMEDVTKIIKKEKNKFESEIKTILHKATQNLLSIINENLDEKLPGFLIIGETPEFNDGEDCLHSVDYAISHIEFDPNKSVYSHRLANLLERQTSWRLLFPELSEYEDGYEYLSAIKDGKANSIIAYKTEKQKDLIDTCLIRLNEAIEMCFKTNYKIHAVLKSDGTYSIEIGEHVPEY